MMNSENPSSQPNFNADFTFPEVPEQDNGYSFWRSDQFLDWHPENSGEVRKRVKTIKVNGRQVCFLFNDLKILKEEFQKANNLTPARANELAEQLGRNVRAICDAFTWMRKQQLRMTPDQKRQLYEEFSKNSILPHGRAQAVANRLRLPVRKVRRWFCSRKPPEVTPFLRPDQLLVLRNEFNASIRAPLDRAKLIADRIGVSPLRVVNWFYNERRKAGLKARGPKQIKIPKPRPFQRRKWTPVEMTVLKQELEEGPNLSSSKVEELANLMGRTVEGVRRMFGKLKKNGNLVTRVKRKLTVDEERHLEMEMSKDRSLPYARAKAIAESLGIRVSTVRHWFEGHRPKSHRKLRADQKQVLEEEFLKDSKLTHERALEIARRMGAKHSTVVGWFGSQRLRRSMTKPTAKLKEEQTETLKAELVKDSRLGNLRAEEIGKRIGIPATTVKYWFKRYRTEAQKMPAPTKWTPHQLQVLTSEFAKCQNLRRGRDRKLAEFLGLSPEQVKRWFFTRRNKLRGTSEPKLGASSKTDVADGSEEANSQDI